MNIETLSLLPFRCHAAWRHTVPQGAAVVGLVGPNGSGKTAVLEALALLAPGRGLSGQELRAHVPHGGRHWGFHATLQGGATLAQQFKGSARNIVLNGETVAQEHLPRLGSVVALTPHTDFLFSGPPEVRRRWLDDAAMALNPAHAQAVARFKVHRQGRLKILGQGIISGDWLDAEEHMAAEWGLKVLQGRLGYLNQLAAYLEELTLNLRGTALEVLEDPNPVAALQGKFYRSREIDARLNRTHAGPNTLDVGGNLLLPHAPVALGQASSGQHKRALLAWLRGHTRLVAAVRQKPPLVLIDEFAAHLDAQRRTELLAHLRTLGCQVWLADVDLPEMEGLHRIAMG